MIRIYITAIAEQQASTSGEQQVKELFDMKNFPHWFDPGEEDFDDYSEEDRVKNPEYFLTDEEVEEIIKQMTETERKTFKQLKEYHKADYRQKGDICPMSEHIRHLMKINKPGIPNETKELQEALHEKLLNKARMKSELRERGELPEEKPKVKRVRPVFMGPATRKETEEDGTIVIKVIPGEDPYAELENEEDYVIDMTGMELASEEDLDNESADDLSVVTIDSMTNINKEKVKELWKQMLETKVKEAEILQSAK